MFHVSHILSLFQPKKGYSPFLLCHDQHIIARTIEHIIIHTIAIEHSMHHSIANTIAHAIEHAIIHTIAIEHAIEHNIDDIIAHTIEHKIADNIEDSIAHTMDHNIAILN